MSISGKQECTFYFSTFHCREWMKIVTFFCKISNMRVWRHKSLNSFWVGTDFCVFRFVSDIRGWETGISIKNFICQDGTWRRVTKENRGNVLAFFRHPRENNNINLCGDKFQKQFTFEWHLIREINVVKFRNFHCVSFNKFPWMELVIATLDSLHCRLYI